MQFPLPTLGTICPQDLTYPLLAATSISTARPVNTAAPKSKVNDELPKTYSYFKAHSPVRRAFNKKSAAKTNNFNEKVKTTRVNNVSTAGPKVVVSAAVGNGENVVKSLACWIWRPTGNVIEHTSKDSGSYMLKRFDYGNPQYTLQDQGIFNSGCSRHMTGNKSFLTDYQEVDGGFVAFARSPKGGKITRKGKIRTGKLDFEDVYFVKELKFNLFSVSQMCDKKNNVLFTETECLVLSPDFKLLDESQVLLKVPRQNNMYSFDLKNVVPSGGLTCLFAKATIDESNLWHRRLGHINFKTMNKLVRGNLNRVLVTKPHNKTPYELLISRPPNLDIIKPFGCPVTILNTLDHLGKFEGKADEGFFVGYSINSKAFRVFNTRTRKVEENLHVKFLENKSNVAGSGLEWLFDIYSLTKSMNSEPITAGNQTNSDADDKDDDEVPGKGDEGVNKVSRNDDQERTDSSTQDINTVGPGINTASTNMPSLEETDIFDRAYADEDVGGEADLNNLETTMNVSPIPTTRIHKDHPKDQIIGDLNLSTQTRRMINFSKENAMVYRNKKDERGIVVRNKARLVAQGYTQEEGIDYDEVFAHVARIEAIRLFLANTSFMGLIVYQMDVKSAFLYGTIEEEVYVCQPPGFEDLQFPDMVYKAASTLIETNKALNKDEEAEDVDVHLYRSMIGSLIYLTASKSDIMFVVCACAIDSPFDLESFSNSDYARASLDRKSTTRDETVYNEWEDRMERAATTASSLEAE
ncbi:retrovirus-related pol polyprotein from transposon TNT 1-94 [Tanacetum coccineum]